MATLADINNTLMQNNALQEQSDKKLDALAQLWADYTFDYRRRQEDEAKQALEDQREASTSRSGGAVRGAVERASNAAGRGLSAFDSLMSDPRSLVPLAAFALRNALKKGLVAGTVIAFADEAAEAITDYFGSPEYKTQVEAGLLAGGFGSLIGKRFGVVAGAIVASMSDEQRTEAMEAAKEVATKFGEIYDQLNLPGFKEIGAGISRGLDGLSSFVQGDWAGFGNNFAESLILLGTVGTALAPKAVASGLLGLAKFAAGFAFSGGTAAAVAAPAATAGAVTAGAIAAPAIAIVATVVAGYLASQAFKDTELYKEWKATNDKVSALVDEGITGQESMSLAETSISDGSLTSERPVDRAQAAIAEQAMADYRAGKDNTDYTALQISGLERQVNTLEQAIAKGPNVFNWNIEDEKQQLEAVQQKLAALRIQQGQERMDRYGARTTGADIQVATQQAQANDAMGRGAPTIVNAPQTSNVSNSQPVMFSNNRPSSNHKRFTSAD